MRQLSSAVLLLLFAFACDSSSEDAGITGRFSGLIPFTAEQATSQQQVLTLVLTETDGVVSGNGTLSITRENGDVSMFNFTVSGTVAESNFFLRWIPAGDFEDTYEGRVDRETNLSGVFRRDTQQVTRGVRGVLTVENVVLQRE